MKALNMVLAVIIIGAVMAGFVLIPMRSVSSVLKKPPVGEMLVLKSQIFLPNVAESLAQSDSPDKAAAVDTLMRVVRLTELGGDPLDIALSMDRTSLDRESLDKARAFVSRNSKATTMTEITKIETIETSCDMWMTFASPGSTEFKITSELKNGFYRSLTGNKAGSLGITSPLNVAKTAFEEQDMILSKFCAGDCGYTKDCISCWEIYLDNKNNPSNALTALQDAGCADSCAMMCASVKESTVHYKKAVSSATADEKVAHMSTFLGTGIRFS